MSQSAIIRLVDLNNDSVQRIPDTGGELTATGASELYLDLPATEVLGAMQVGDDLIINLANGSQIIIRDFFAFGEAGEVLDDFGAPVEVDAQAASSGGWGTGLSSPTNLGIVAALVFAGVQAGDSKDAAPADDPADPMDPDPTAAEQALATINAYTGSNTAPTVANYSAAGVTGVTADNLTGVNAQVAASTNTALTAADINPFVTATNTATTTINAYTGSNTAPTAADYSNIGADGVTAANLAGVNAQVAASSDDTLTAADIAAFIGASAASLTTINAFTGSNTAPTANDYRNIGATGVNATNLAGVNAQVAASSDDSLTAADIAPFVTATNAAFTTINAYDGTNTAPTAANYESAGVDGITAANLDGVNAQVAAASSDSLSPTDIEGFVTAAATSLTTINAYDGENTAPTLNDYRNVGVTVGDNGVTAANLAALNSEVSRVEEGTTLTTMAIEMLLPRANILTEINAYDGTGTGTAPTPEDYAAVGVTGITADRVAVANALLAAENADKEEGTVLNTEQLQALLDIAQDMEDALGTLPPPSTMTVTTGSFNIRIDIDGDGTADMSVEVETNDLGVPVSITYDFDNDGSTDRSERYTVDTDGDRTAAAIDLDVDGTADETRAYTVNAAGRRTAARINTDADGSVERIETYTLNAAGQRTGAAIDSNADGTVDQRETYTLNAAGIRTGVTIDTADNGTPDGTVDRRETYTLNAAGQRTQTEFDDNNDGTVDRRETYTLNAAGQRTATAFDGDADGDGTADGTADGTVDRRETYTLNDAGQRRATNFFDRDANGTVDGTADRSESYTLNAVGQITETEFDDDADGNPDRTVTNDNLPPVTAAERAVAALVRINAYRTGGSTAPTIADYNAAGVTGVTTTAIRDQLNMLVRGQQSSNDDLTAATLQPLVTMAIANVALATLNAWDGDPDDNGNPSAPTLADYTAAGVGSSSAADAVTAANIAGVNARLAGITQAQTVTQIDTLVTQVTTALTTINGYNGTNTAPQLTDYTNAGVEEVSAANLAEVNARLANISQAQTVTQIDALAEAATTALAVIDAYTGSNTAPTTNHYRDIGLAGDHEVTATNLAGVNAQLATAPANMRELSNLRTYVTTTNAALETINNWDGDPNDDGTPPAPTLINYQNAGADDVTAANLAGVNHRLGGITQAQTVTQINTLAGQVTTALATLNAWDGDPDNNGNPSAPTLAVYQNAGIDGVTAANLDEVNMRLGPVTDTLSAADITALANAGASELALGRINDYRTGDSTTAPGIADYIAVGLTGVTTAIRNELNSLVDGHGTVLTVTNIEPLFDMAVTTVALDAINDYRTGDSTTAPSEADYMNAGVTLTTAAGAVTASVLAALNALVRERESDTDDLTATTIQPLVATANINVALETINAYRTDPDNVTPPTQAVYTAAGATGANAVTADNLAAVNLQVVAAGSTAVTAQTLGGLVTAANMAITMALATINAYDGDNAEPTATNYQTIGVTGINDPNPNLPGVNAQVAASNDDSLERADIQTFVTNANTSLAAIRGNTAPTLTDYLNVGVEDVTAAFGNLARVNEQVQNANNRATLTPTQIQALVTAAALDKINDYRMDQTDSDNTLTTDDYRIAGINNVSDDILTDLNAWVAMQANALQMPAIQAQATMLDNESGAGAARATINAWDGTGGTAPTEQDYMTARVSDVMADNVDFYNNRVAGITDVQTLDELNTLVSQANAALVIINAYDGDNTAPTVDHYTNIGLGDTNEVTAANLLGVNAQLATAAANMRGLTNLEGFISTTNMALQTIRDYTGGTPTPGVNHYTNAGVTGVTTDNLMDVNDEVAKPASAHSTVTEIQALVALVKINAYQTGDGVDDTPTLPDYMAAGATAVTADNLAAVNARLAGLSDDQDATEINTIAAAFTTINAYDRSNTEPSQADYDAIGVTITASAGITVDNLRSVVNDRVSRSSNDQLDTDDIQEFVTGAPAYSREKIRVYDQPSDPTPSVADYAVAGVTNFEASRLALVNELIINVNDAGNFDVTIPFVQNLVYVLTDIANAPIDILTPMASQRLSNFTSATSFDLGINSDNDQANTRDWLIEVVITSGQRVLTYKNAAGTTVRTETYTVNSEGVRTQIEIDGIDSSGNGSLETAEFSDGTVDQTRYDDGSGTVVGAAAADGTIDRIVTVVVDGTVTRTEVDNDADGVADGTTSITTRFDANSDGTTDRIEYDTDADMTPDRTEVFQIITSGLTLTDTDNDGVIDEIQIADDTNAELLGEYTAHGVTKSLRGINEIRLPSGESTLTVNALTVYNTLAREPGSGDPGTLTDPYRLLIQGDSNDTVSLTNTASGGLLYHWTAGANQDLEGTTYTVYTAQRDGAAFGTAWIQQGITFLDPAVAAALTTINSHDASDDTVAEPTPADYTAIGVTGVTDDNLAGINTQVDDNNANRNLDADDIRGYITAFTGSLATINAWDGDTTSTTRPTPTDYRNIGITGVTDTGRDNLDGINARMVAAADNQTAAQIEALFTEVNEALTRIRANFGIGDATTPTMADYANAGVREVTNANILNGLNRVIRDSSNNLSFVGLQNIASVVADVADAPNILLPTSVLAGRGIHTENSFNFGLNNDGVFGPDWRIFAEINGNQRVISYRGPQGSTNLRRETHTVDSNGVSTRIEIDGVDSDGNGTLDTIEFFDGTVDVIRHDDGMNGGVAADGTIDRTEVFQITTSDGLVLTDAGNDGTVELVQVTADADAELLGTDYTAHGVSKSLRGITDIRMHPTEASTLTVDALNVYNTFARQAGSGDPGTLTPNYRLLIQGGNDDTVRLTASDSGGTSYELVMRDTDNDDTADTEDVNGTTYAIYDAEFDDTRFGTVLVQQGVNVTLQDPAVVAILMKINTYDGSTNPPTVADYAALGVTGVTEANLSGINSQVDANNNDGDLTAMDLQGYVTVATDALTKINAYTGSGTAPDADDYTNAGVTGVTSANRADINTLVGDWNMDSNNAMLDLSIADLQAFVALDKIDDYRDDQSNPPTIEDYRQLLGTDAPAVDAYLNDYNSAVDAETSALTLTSARELVTNINHREALALMQNYNGSNTAPTHIDYAALGITEAFASRIHLTNELIRITNQQNYLADYVQYMVDAVGYIETALGALPAASATTVTEDSSDVQFIHIDIDIDGDGTADQRMTVQTSNSFGLLIVPIRIDYDFNNDGTRDRRESLDYGSDNQYLDTIRFDADANDSNDGAENYTRNTDGHLTQTDVVGTNSEGGLGGTVRTEAYMLNAAGHRIRTDFNDDNAGDAERIEHYTVNAAGQRTQVRFDGVDSNNNGTIDPGEVADTTVDRIEHYTLNAAGHRTATRFDDNADGTIDRTETYMVTADGHRTRAEFDTDADGTTDRIETYSVNGAGRHSSTAFDLNGNGTIDIVGTNADYREYYALSPLGHRQVVYRLNVDTPANNAVDRIDFLTAEGNQNLAWTLSADPAALGLHGIPQGFSLTGLADIRLHGATNTTLTIDATTVARIADGDPTHEIRIQGDSNDQVDLRGIIDDNSGTPTEVQRGTITYRSITAMAIDGTTPVGVVLIQSGVMYSAPGAAALTKIDGYTTTVTDMMLVPTVDDYLNAGVTGVTKANLTGVNGTIAAENERRDMASDATPLTVEDIQDLLVLARINTHRTDDDDSTDDSPDPTAEDYQHVLGDPTAISAANLTEYNRRVADATTDFTVETARELVATAKINLYNGTTDAPTVADYATAGVTGASASRIGFVNLILATQDPGATDFTTRSLHNLFLIAAEIEDVFGVLPASSAVTLDTTTANTWVFTIDSNNDTMDDARVTVVYTANPSGDMAMFVPGSITYDFDNDGTADRRVEYAPGPTFLQNEVRIDRDADGTRDQLNDGFTYSNGNLTSVSFDFNDDSTVDRIETYMVNTDGHRTQTNFYDDGTVEASNPTPDRIEDYILNANAQLTETRFNDNGDSSVDRIEQYNLNTAGHRIQTTFYDDGTVEANNPTPDRIEVYTVNANGHRTRTSFDNHGMDGSGTPDGTADRIEIYTLNDAGYRTSTRFDDDADGTGGTGGDEDGDGTGDRIETYSLNGAGHRLATEADLDADGMINNNDYREYHSLTTAGNLRASFRLNVESTANNNVDRIVFGPGDDHQGVTLTLTADTAALGLKGAPANLGLAGLTDIRLHQADDTIPGSRESNTTLTIAATTVADIAGGDATHEILVQGNAGDQVFLRGSFGNNNGSPMMVNRGGVDYLQYTAQNLQGETTGLLLVQSGVDVDLLSAVALRTITDWDGDADNNNVPARPTVDNYLTAGITGVTATNLDAVNMAVASENETRRDEGGAAQTAGEVQTLVSRTIINTWDGTDDAPTHVDYATVGVTEAFANRINIINLLVEGVNEGRDPQPAFQAATLQPLVRVAARIEEVLGEDQHLPSDILDIAYTSGSVDVGGQMQERVQLTITIDADNTGEDDTEITVLLHPDTYAVDRITFDLDNDNTTDRAERFANRNNQMHIDIDTNLDGTFNSADNQRIQTLFVRTNPPVFNETVQYVTLRGNTTLINREEQIFRNAEGHITRASFSPTGAAFSSIFWDRIEHYTLDSSGQRIETRIDNDDDGTLNFRSATFTIDRIEQYTLNAAGFRTSTTFHDDGNSDTAADRIETYTLNADGHRTSTEFDLDGNGTIDAIGTNTDYREFYVLSDSGNRTVTFRLDVETQANNNVDSIDFGSGYQNGDVTFTLPADLTQVNLTGAPTDISLSGLATINLHDGSDTTLTLAATTVADITGGDSNHEIIINGDSGDELVLRGAFDDNDGTPTVEMRNGQSYHEYSAQNADQTSIGTLLVHTDIDVKMLSAPALAKINAYTFNAPDAPTLQDYRDLGVTDGDSSHLRGLNLQVAAANVARAVDPDNHEPLTLTDIQRFLNNTQAASGTMGIINSYDPDDSNNDTPPTPDDYLAFGVRGVTMTNLDTVNMRVAQATDDSLDADDIQGTVDTINRESSQAIIDAYDGTTTAPTYLDYANIGEADVFATRVSFINTFIALANQNNVDDLTDRTYSSLIRHMEQLEYLFGGLPAANALTVSFDDNSNPGEYRIAIDSDNDGSPEARLNFSVINVADSNSLTTARFDLDADGQIDWVQGVGSIRQRLSEITKDIDNNGVLDLHDFFQYGGISTNLTQYVYGPVQGSLPFADVSALYHREDYTVTSDGHRTRTRFRDTGGDDSDPVTRIEHYTVDNGQRTQTRFDDDADGTIDRIEVYTLNPTTGFRTRTNFYDDGTIDGSGDRIENYTVDASGHITQIIFDNDANGTPNRIETYSKFQAGHPTRADIDNDGDPITPDRHAEIYTLNDMGRRIRTEIHDDGNTNTNADRIDTHAVDLQGRRTSTFFDLDGNGTIDALGTNTDYREFYSHPITGERLATFRVDFAADNNSVDSIHIGGDNPYRSVTYTLSSDVSQLNLVGIPLDFDLADLPVIHLQDKADTVLNIDAATVAAIADGDASHTTLINGDDGDIVRLRGSFDDNGGNPTVVNQGGVDYHRYSAQNSSGQTTGIFLIESGVEVDLVTESALTRINAYNNLDSATNNDTPPTVTDYLDVLVSGIKPSNLDAVNMRVATFNNDSANANADLDADDIQGYIDTINSETALARINAYRFNNAPTAADYATVGVTDAHASRIDLLNNFVSQENRASPRRSSTVEKLQNLLLLVADMEETFGSAPLLDNFTITSTADNASGTPGFRYDFAFDHDNDDDGNNANPTPDVKVSAKVISGSNFATETVSYDFDGDDDFDRVDVVTSDSMDRRTRVDIHADGTTTTAADRSETYEYSTSNDKLLQTNFHDDGITTTAADRVEIYAHNPQGHRIRTYFNDDGGTNEANATRIEHYTLNDAAQRTQTRFDDDADGNIDRIEDYTLNRAGHRIQTRFFNDGTAKGFADRIESYRVNASGQVTRTTFDDDADGTIDRIESYTLNPIGQRTRANIDSDADGTIDRVEIYTLDRMGNRTRADIHTDGNTDTDADHIEIYTLNAQGHRTSARVDGNGDDDGNINDSNDYWEYYLNSARGNLEVAFRVDFEANNANDRIVDSIRFGGGDANSGVSFTIPDDISALDLEGTPSGFNLGNANRSRFNIILHDSSNSELTIDAEMAYNINSARPVYIEGNEGDVVNLLGNRANNYTFARDVTLSLNSEEYEVYSALNYNFLPARGANIWIGEDISRNLRSTVGSGVLIDNDDDRNFEILELNDTADFTLLSQYPTFYRIADLNDIRLDDDGASHLILNIGAIRAITSDNASEEIIIQGDSDDRVTLNTEEARYDRQNDGDGNAELTERDGKDYVVYNVHSNAAGIAVGTLLIEDGVMVTI